VSFCFEHFQQSSREVIGEVCPLTRSVGPYAAPVVLFSLRTLLLQPTTTQEPKSEFIHQVRFAPGLNFGEAHPWQNGVAERWVGNCRRDLLDHVIVLNERHLKLLMSEYERYYDDDRTHLALEKETPAGREAEVHHGAGCRVISMPRLGGLHHRYERVA
jgi:hypothetical protein